jgi:NAD(P)H-hydrate epimerase
MRTGAGLVTLGIPASLNSTLETQVIEAMTSPLPETGDGILGEGSFNTIMDLLSDKKCLALGPGLGTSTETQKLVLCIIKESTKPIVIDADGLNCLIGHTQILKNRDAPIILTPHPGEMARLIDTTAGDIQQDRIYFARDFAEKFHIHVVLKGARTVIAHPDGNVFINPTGNSGMASGGMGDVLTGVIAGFISQGYPLETATHLGVYLHGAAADDLAQRIGPYGFLATEVMDAIPAQIKTLANM